MHCYRHRLVPVALAALILNGSSSLARPDPPLLPPYAAGGELEGGLPQWTTEEHLGQPRFDVRTFHRFSETPDVGRLDVIFEVVNDFLQFIRVDSNAFEASVEVSLAVSKKGGAEALRLVRTLSKRVASYELTNSRRDFLVGMFTVEQPPGEYNLQLLMTDRESSRREKIERKVTMNPSPAQAFDLSDVMLAGSAEADPETRLPKEPIAGGVAGEPAGTLYAYFDLWRTDPTTPCQVMLNVADRQGKEKARDSLAIVGGETLAAFSMPLSLEGLGFGRYDLFLTAECAGKEVARRTTFDVNSHGLPGTIRDLDQAIKELRHIAGREEIAKLTDQFSSQREAAFIAFWNELYPCPGEAVNGKMLEYYARISYANDNFSTSTPGWETDRGRVLAIYGRPSEVERHAFEEDGTPYEIWYYNHLGKRFVFRDEYGFGDYRLTTPLW